MRQTFRNYVSIIERFFHLSAKDVKRNRIIIQVVGDYGIHGQHLKKTLQN